MADEFLHKKIEHIDVEAISGFSGMLHAFEWTSFQSRALAHCYEVYREMLEDPERPTIFLGLAGAMVPAGMKKLVSLLIRRHMVDVLVSTGANMYHDVVEALGFHHYIGWPDVDDCELYRHGIDRIYDIFAKEKEYRTVDQIIKNLADVLAGLETNSISSRRFMYHLGQFIDKNGSESKGDSIVWNCWRVNVPIFIPAFCDSSLGLAVTQHYIHFLKEKRKPLLIDQIKDNYEIFSIKRASKKTGVIYIGGGVPKNYIQQTAYLMCLFGIPDSGHDYGIQLTTDRPEYGGLSGCTFKEGLSWGKERVTGRYATCYCDATIAFPIIVKAVLESCVNLDKRQALQLLKD
ncbi:MAG: deoxyhypusine synthase family protein [Candidatus Bathyarchaeia archaeon]